MDGRTFLFAICAIFSYSNGASFHIINKGGNPRIIRSAPTTIHPSRIDGQDIAGIRDGSDILNKGAISGLPDGSDIIHKDAIASQQGVDGRDIAGVRDGSDILTGNADSNMGGTVDGRDIAGVRDGSDILTGNTDTNPGGTIDGTDISGVRDGKDMLIQDSSQNQNVDGSNTEQNQHSTEPIMSHDQHQGSFQPMTDFSNSEHYYHGNQFEHFRNMRSEFNQHHETTTQDPEHSEHETTTTDPDMAHSEHSNNWFNQHGNGWYNPLFMTRPGELPPMALPMTAPEGHDAPVALALTANPEHSTGQQDGQGSEQGSSNAQTEHGQSGSEGMQTAESPAHTEQAQSSDTAHIMPQALPLVGNPETQENTAPVALPQKGFSPSSTERRMKPGFGVGKKPGAKAFAPRPGKKPGQKIRPPPNWGPPTKQVSGAPMPSVVPTVIGGPTPTVPGQGPPPGMGESEKGGNSFMNNMMAMNMMGGGGPGGDMFSEMMEMQRRMMRNNPQMLQQQMNMYQQMYRQMYPQMFGSQAGATEGGEGGEAGAALPQTMAGMGGMGMMPMMGMGEEGGGMMGMMGGEDGGNMQARMMQAQVCQTNPDSPMCKMLTQQANMTAMMQQLALNQALSGRGMMGMGMETQIEGPFGEMDMEPGELDIEGPLAHQLLLQSSLISRNAAQQTTHPMHNEITLNHHVLKALQDRFGVNTTRGIQQMATDPAFQAFMFQVLRQSQQVIPGEYNANLSQVQVNQILAGLDGSAAGNDRLPPGNLDKAQLHEQPHAKGTPPMSVLTLDRQVPIVPQPLVGQPLPAQPGSFQALVQQAMGITTKAPQTLGTIPGSEISVNGTSVESVNGTTSENSTATNGTEVGVAANKTMGAETAAVLLGIGTPGVASSPVSPTQLLPGLEQPAQLLPGLNQQQNQLLGSMLAGQDGENKQLLGVQGGMGQTLPGQQQVPGMVGGTFGFGEKKGDNEIRNKDAIPGLSQDARNRAFGKVDKNKFANTAAGFGITPGVTVDNRPIGLQEAFPGANGTVPVEKAQPKYTSSTAFAIAAMVLIAIIILIGPVVCALCKMREKRNEQQRKMNALKNREVSENNIMEAMMLHDFGSSGANSVTNEAATSPNYYSSEQTRYDTVDPEIECLNQSHPLP